MRRDFMASEKLEIVFAKQDSDGIRRATFTAERDSLGCYDFKWSRGNRYSRDPRPVQHAVMKVRLHTPASPICDCHIEPSARLRSSDPYARQEECVSDHAGVPVALSPGGASLASSAAFRRGHARSPLSFATVIEPPLMHPIPQSRPPSSREV